MGILILALTTSHVKSFLNLKAPHCYCCEMEETSRVRATTSIASQPRGRPVSVLQRHCHPQNFAPFEELFSES